MRKLLLISLLACFASANASTQDQACEVFAIGALKSAKYMIEHDMTPRQLADLFLANDLGSYGSIMEMTLLGGDILNSYDLLETDEKRVNMAFRKCMAGEYSVFHDAEGR